jgi:exoribonuclease-2
MPNSNPPHLDLQATAKQIMEERGFQPDFPGEVTAQLATLKGDPPISARTVLRDMRNLLWSSIDNDTSRDLDQIEFAERSSNGDVKVMIGIADVDAFVSKLTPIDQHAARETTTVYTGIRNFPIEPRHRIRSRSRREPEIVRRLLRDCPKQGTVAIQLGRNMAGSARCRSAKGQ